MVIFKDRVDAGKKLATLLKGKYTNPAVVSLLRGGVIIGSEIAKIIKSPHYGLPVTKISAPNQPELAIGALCFDQTYLERETIESLRIEKTAIVTQMDEARRKFSSYSKRFSIKKTDFVKIKNKTILLVDDGIATGATVKAAYLFLKTLKYKKIVVSAPVAPENFSERGFDEVVIFHKDPELVSVSRFYKEFPQVTDLEAKKLLSI